MTQATTTPATTTAAAPASGTTRILVLYVVMALLILAVGWLQSWVVALTILNLCLISAVMSLGVNIQWGYAGLFNAGIMGFAALGGIAAVHLAVVGEVLPARDLGQADVVGTRERDLVRAVAALGRAAQLLVVGRRVGAHDEGARLDAHEDRPVLHVAHAALAERLEAQAPDDEALVDRGEDGLHRRRRDEAGFLPFCDRELAEGRVGTDLAGDGHDHEIAPLCLIRGRADDGGGPLLGAALIGEGERD